MKRMLITGGSGFIGTILICNLLRQDEYEILNIDINRPKIAEYYYIWKSIDLLDKEKLMLVCSEFRPDYVIHLAARTDLKGNELNDYSSNTIGVSNLLEALDLVSNLKRVIFASSMYV